MNKGNKTTHEWVTYVNPRNHKVQVKACNHCGKLKTAAISMMLCDGTYANSNMLLDKGWEKIAIHA